MGKVRVAFRRKKIANSEHIPAEVIVCRAIDILLGEGFNSPTYQKLLRTKMFQQAVTDACSTEIQSALNNLPPELRVINHSCFYHEKFFFDSTLSRGLKNRTILGLAKPECLDLLRSYIDGWLKQEWQMDFASFMTGFRAIYASLVLIGRDEDGACLVKQLAEEIPNGPSVAGYELWLQRKAALMLYRTDGFESLLRRMHEVRASLIWYLDIQADFSDVQKKAIRELVVALPDGDLCDNDFSLRKWLGSNVA